MPTWTVTATAKHPSERPTPRPRLGVITILEMEFSEEETHARYKAKKHLEKLGFERVIIIRIVKNTPRWPTQENILPHPIRGMTPFL